MVKPGVGSVDGKQMTLIDHLGELRRRVIVSLLAIALGAVVCFISYENILRFLTGPYEEATGRVSLLVTGPLDPFLTRLKIASYGGIALASPIVLWQMWRFITPGLHKREKRYAIPFIFSSILLFALGVFIALESFPRTLDFLLSMGGDELEVWLTPDKYLSFVTLMMLGFGAAFELPIVLVFLLIARVINTRQLRNIRRYAIVGIVTGAAIITPSQDPFTLLLMAAPMYFFYESSIVIGRILKR